MNMNAEAPMPFSVVALGPGPDALYYCQPITPAMLDDEPAIRAMVNAATARLRAEYTMHGRDLDAEGGVQRVAIPTVDVDRYEIPNAFGLVDMSKYET